MHLDPGRSPAGMTVCAAGLWFMNYLLCLHKIGRGGFLPGILLFNVAIPAPGVMVLLHGHLGRFRQVQNGMYIRMALLAVVLGMA